LPSEFTVNAGRLEILNGVNDVVTGIIKRELKLEQLDESRMEKSFQFGGLTKIDLVLRTGETRLSDFLLWQVREGAVMSFTEELWPEFTCWGFLRILFYCQQSHLKVDNVSRKSDA